MRLSCEAGEFDLPIDFDATLNRYNVIISDSGEQTAPITLPATSKNLALIKHSDRIDSIYKPITSLDVIVNSGLFSRRCNMAIHNTDAEGISCTLYFDSGSFYSKLKNTRLNWLSWPVYKVPDGDNDRDDHINYLLNILHDAYENQTNEVFCVAPLRTTTSVTRKNNEGKEVTNDLILNGFEQFRATNMGVWATGYFYQFEGDFEQTYLQNGANVRIDTGYGITPFPYLDYMLTFIFQKFDYSFSSQNIVDRIGSYKKICVLNNIADTIYTGILNISQVVPDVTIKEFLDAVEILLAGKFVFDEISREAKFVFFSKILAQVPDMDLTPFLVTKPNLESPEFSKIILESESTKDTARQEHNDEIEVNTIVFPFLEQVTDTREYLFEWDNPSGTGDSRIENVMLPLLDVGAVIHKNSSVVINDKDGVKVEKEKEESGKVYFGCAVHNEPIQGQIAGSRSLMRRVFWHQYDENSDKGDDSNDIKVEEVFYHIYRNFRANSNISLTAEMRIPALELNSLNLHSPKIVNGQKVIIERIVQSLAGNGNQVVTMRTLRNYLNR